MIYALIKGGIITNCIVMSSTETNFPTADQFGADFFLRVDNLTPHPGIGWTYTQSGGFVAPIVAPPTFTPPPRAIPAPANIHPASPPATPPLEQQNQWQHKILTEKGLKAQEQGAQIIAQIYAINEANMSSGTLTNAHFAAMLADTNLANIERLLWSGSLVTALALINALPSPNPYFSSANIASIVAALTAAVTPP